MASAVHEPITESGGGAPSWVQGQSPWSGGQAETFLAFGRSLEAANLSTFLKFGNAKNHRYLCCLCKNEV